MYPRLLLRSRCRAAQLHAACSTVTGSPLTWAQPSRTSYVDHRPHRISNWRSRYLSALPLLWCVC